MLHPEYDKPFAVAAERVGTSLAVFAKVAEPLAPDAPALVEGREALAAMYSEYDGKVGTLRTERDTLRAERDALLERLKATNVVKKRAPFAVIPDFTPETHLDAEGQALYKDFYAWINYIFDVYIEPLERGIKPNSVSKAFPKGEPLRDGTMHLIYMRNVGHIVISLALALDQWGDPRAQEGINRTVRIVFDPKRMATKWGPLAKREGATAFFKNSAGKMESTEQVGLQRFNYQGAGYDNDHMHILDDDLHLATVGVAKLTAKTNLSVKGSPEAYKLLRRYADDRNTRMKFVGAIYEPKQKWYVRGKSLTHAGRARAIWHNTECLDLGDPEQLEAAVFYHSHLFADVDIIETPEGPVAVSPHYTASLGRVRGDRVETGYQDVTYKREDAPLEIIGNRLGLPGYTDEYIAAVARTGHLLVLNTGPKGKTIAAAVGGNGPVEHKDKLGVSLKGKLYGPSRWKNGRVTETEDPLQVARGPMLAGSAWAKDHPEFLETLVLLDERPDSIEHKRYGSRVGRIFYGPRLER